MDTNIFQMCFIVALASTALIPPTAWAQDDKAFVGYTPTELTDQNLDALRVQTEDILKNPRKWLFRKNFKGHAKIAYSMAEAKLSFSDDGVSMKFSAAGFYEPEKERDPAIFRYEFRYDELADVAFDATTCSPTKAPLPHGMEIDFTNLVVGPEICNTLFSIGQRYRKDREKFAKRFAEQVASYRAKAVKPAMTEDVRRLIIQGEALRQQKNYEGAIRLFRQVLRNDPTVYPVAWFNLALLYEQQENYSAAIAAMRNYLTILPEAQDARAAQDKIYEWEMAAPPK